MVYTTNFAMFTQLFNKVDHITKSYITDISSKAIIAITPIASVGIAIAFIIYGWLIIRGAIDMPLTSFVNRCLRVSIITSIAFAGGLYQTELVELIKTLPDELSKALIKYPSIEIRYPSADMQITILIDSAATQGFNRAAEAFEEAAFLNSDGLLYGILGALILIATSSLVAIGGAFILLAKLALILLIGFGPFFIMALLWQPTYRFFEQWIAQLLSYIVFIVLLAAVFGFMMDIFANYMADFEFDGKQNVSYTLGGALSLSILSIVLLLKLSSMANALAKGVTFGHLWNLSAGSGNSSRRA
ncbi:type IV secretion system protein [Bartonella sp. B30(2025)]